MNKEKNIGNSRSIKRKKYIDKVTSSKENAINFLKTIGIIDENSKKTLIYE
jgi:hypothetical protein